jgi:hypothetical protein
MVGLLYHVNMKITRLVYLSGLLYIFLLFLISELIEEIKGNVLNWKVFIIGGSVVLPHP